MIWDNCITATNNKAETIRDQARHDILATLGDLDPTWIRSWALNLEHAVQASQPDVARDRLEQAAAGLRESSSERAKLASDLQAASPQERLSWLNQQEVAADREWRYQERVEPTTRRVRPEDERGHRPDRDIAPRRGGHLAAAGRR